MTNKKKIVLLFACLSLMFFIGSTAYTYAKYFSQTKRDIGTNIKKWNIKLNNQDIKNGANISNLINVEFEGSEHVAANTLAPGSEGSFIIELDYSNVEVSFKYEISIDSSNILDSEGNPLTTNDIGISKLIVDDVEIPKGNGLKISNEVNIETETDKVKEIEVFLTWKDGDESELTNEEDTEIAVNNEDIKFKVNMDFEQITE